MTHSLKSLPTTPPTQQQPDPSEGPGLHIEEASDDEDDAMSQAPTSPASDTAARKTGFRAARAPMGQQPVKEAEAGTPPPTILDPEVLDDAMPIDDPETLDPDYARRLNAQHAKEGVQVDPEEVRYRSWAWLLVRVGIT